MIADNGLTVDDDEYMRGEVTSLANAVTGCIKIIQIIIHINISFSFRMFQFTPT